MAPRGLSTAHHPDHHHHNHNCTTYLLHTEPKPIPLPRAAPEDDDEALAGKGPRSWFQKLGTKRSTTGAAAAAAKKKSEEEAAAAAAEGGGKGVDGKENRKGEGPGGVVGGGSKAVVRFKYQAGYTNAIRRPVSLKDLL